MNIYLRNEAHENNIFVKTITVCTFDMFTVKLLLENLLQKLIQLQSVLLLQNSETQYIESGQKK